MSTWMIPVLAVHICLLKMPLYSVCVCGGGGGGVESRCLIIF